MPQAKVSCHRMLNALMYHGLLGYIAGVTNYDASPASQTCCGQGAIGYCGGACCAAGSSCVPNYDNPGQMHCCASQPVLLLTRCIAHVA